MKYHALLLAPIFACVFAAPASSQAVVDNPGICAQIYPDANCENYGPGNPDTVGYSSRGLSAANAFMAAPAWHPSLKKSHTTRRSRAGDGRIGIGVDIGLVKRKRMISRRAMAALA